MFGIFVTSSMACKSYYHHILYNTGDNPPNFGVDNGWLIGEISEIVVGHDIEYILASSVAKVRIFANVYYYSAGAHKTIKYIIFVIHDPENIGETFECML